MWSTHLIPTGMGLFFHRWNKQHTKPPLWCQSPLTDRVNTLGPRQNGRHFADDIFKCIFLNENVWISIKISLKFIPKGPINNIPALVQIMAWRRRGDKPLSEAMILNLPTHICVSRPQWVKHDKGCLFAYCFSHLCTELFATIYFNKPRRPSHD